MQYGAVAVWNCCLVLPNVVNPPKNQTFGDGLYHPFMVILGMAYYWVYHITPIIGDSILEWIQY